MFDNMAKAQNSSFHQSDLEKSLGMSDGSSSLNNSHTQMSEEDKIMSESKKFLNYLKAVKNVVPANADSENTNNLVRLMEQLKSNDTQGIVDMMSGFKEKPQQPQNYLFNTPGGNRENVPPKYQYEYQLDTPDIKDRYRTQPRFEEDKEQSNTINVPDSVNQNYAQFKARQAYAALANKLDAESPGFGLPGDISKLNSDKLSEHIKSSQKKRLEKVLEKEQIQNSKSFQNPSTYDNRFLSPPSASEGMTQTELYLRQIAEEPQLMDVSVDDEPAFQNGTHENTQQSLRHDNLPDNFKENTTNIFDEMEHGEVMRSIGSHLYQDFKNRVQRQQTIQQNLEKEMYRKMNESKVNQKSQRLYLKRIEKDIEDVLVFVDDQTTGLITFNGLGYVLFFLDVFKVQYNEEYLTKLSQKSGKAFDKNMVNGQSLNNFNLINFVTLK